MSLRKAQTAADWSRLEQERSSSQGCRACPQGKLIFYLLSSGVPDWLLIHSLVNVISSELITFTALSKRLYTLWIFANLIVAFSSCAWGYQNEAEVGEGIRNSGIPRSEIWITSKLFEYHHHPEHVEMALKDTLKKLGTDYLDLYLMHWNVRRSSSRLEDWRGIDALTM